MTIKGHKLSDIIEAIFIILWGVIRYGSIALLVVGGIWLAVHSIFIVIFVAFLVLMSNLKVNW